MFKNWCVKEKFNNATNLSHVLMDGGKLSVPFDKLDKFYEKYIECVKNNEKLFVVEQKSEYYNFFVDIDYKSDSALSFEEIKNICKVICDKVKRHGGKDCLISVSQPKKCGDLIKTGVHMNWPGFVVNQNSSLALREHILIVLTQTNSSIDWNEVIDSSVYGCSLRKTKGSGFRMPWSHKMAKHEPCNGNGCESCKYTGKTSQVAYLPLFMYKYGPLSTIINIDQKPNVEYLKMSAIRSESTEYVNVSSPSFSVKEGAFSAEQTKDEFGDEITKKELQDFIRKHMEGQGNSYITKIFKHKDSYLISTTSKYCENLKRSHNSNHVWFYVSGKIIAQKCFCRCETLRGRHSGFCKDFYGRKHELPNHITNKLYPDPGVIKKCPEIKNFVKKPDANISESKVKLEVFINKYISTTKDVKIANLTKKGNVFTAMTTSNYCDISKCVHEDHQMMYQINKGEIYQRCPKCKKNASRKHKLPSTISKFLFPK